jgi:hypothetical protein
MRRGKVTVVDAISRRARVAFKDSDNVVTAELPYAQGLSLDIGDTVAVALFSSNLADGLIIAKF